MDAKMRANEGDLKIRITVDLKLDLEKETGEEIIIRVAAHVPEWTVGWIPYSNNNFSELDMYAPRDDLGKMQRQVQEVARVVRRILKQLPEINQEFEV